MGNYIVVADVKDHAKIGYKDLGFSDDPDYEAFIGKVIDQIEDLIDRYCGVPNGFFKAGGLTFTEELYDWDDEGIIYFSKYPVITFTKLELDEAGVNQTADWTEITSLYYYVYKTYGYIKVVGKYPGHYDQSVRVTYTAGYSAVPDDIKLAAVTLASNLLHSILQRRISPPVQAGTIRLALVVPAIFSDDVNRLLAKYRTRSIEVI